MMADRRAGAAWINVRQGDRRRGGVRRDGGSAGHGSAERGRWRPSDPSDGVDDDAVAGLRAGAMLRPTSRGVARGVALALVAAGAPALASDLPHVTLPYACVLDRGRVVVAPSPERSYRILGAHAAHALTACAPGDANRCRTWQIHKFDLQCGGQRIPWVAFASAVADLRRGAFVPENGRIAWRPGQRIVTHAGAPGVGSAAARRPADIVFPAGYAPLLGTGARLTGQLPALAPTVTEARPVRVAEARPKAMTAPSVPSSPGPPAATDTVPPAPTSTEVQRAAIADGWSTVVTPSRGFEAWRALLALVLVALTWVTLHAVRRRSAATATDAPLAETGAYPGVAPTADGASRASTDAGTPDDAALCAELIARAVDLHRAAREALPGVGSDNLRDILTRDLAAVQRTLLAEALTNDIADGRFARVRPIVAAALADLERIARIITGVLASTARPDSGRLRTASHVPETPEEAFEVLGINPEASRTVVKKIVDGLRQSWHPDHARDTPDRERREERMKQINVAWDLIRRGYGEQAEAKVA